MDNIIIIDKLTKKFLRNGKEHFAISNVSLTVMKGTFTAVVGPSGCGKTTLFNLIGGMLGITSGKIVVNDIDISKLNKDLLSEYRNKIVGYMLQGDNLLNNLTVAENLMLPTLILNNKSSRKASLEMLGRFNILDLADEYPSNISGGERKRVAIARAMMNNPPIVLADEPTNNLDQENSLNVINILKDLSKNGITVLYSTHEKEWTRLADKIIYLDKGQNLE